MYTYINNYFYHYVLNTMDNSYMYTDDGENYDVLENIYGEKYKYDSNDIPPFITLDNGVYIAFMNRFIGVKNNDIIQYYQYLTPDDDINGKYFNDNKHIPFIDQILFTSYDVKTEKVDLETDYFKYNFFLVRNDETIKDSIYSIPMIGDEMNEIFLPGSECNIYFDKNYIYYPLFYNTQNKSFMCYLIEYPLKIEPIAENDIVIDI